VVVCGCCGQENAERFRFCGVCGSALETVGPAEQVRKVVTVLFCDIVGSTALGEKLDPESLRRLLGRYFEVARSCVERHGGTVAKFIGDAVMAVFGAPTAREDDALRAVRAAADLRAAAAGLNEEFARHYAMPFQVRIGVNTGEVVIGTEELALGHLATGDPVNVAARLEQAAAPGQVLLGETTYLLVRDAVVAWPAGPVSAKGKETPLRPYRLGPVREDVPGYARRLDAPIVGRAEERGKLRDGFQRVKQERRPHRFTLFGEAGIGKTRLALEFTRDVDHEAAVFTGRCLSYGEGITYWPLAEMVKAATLHRPIEELLAGHEQGTAIAAGVAHAVGLGKRAADRQDTFWAFGKLFEALAGERPVVLVFDDVHWAEPTLLDLVDHLTNWTGQAPVFLLCLARIDLLDRRPAWSDSPVNATSLLLEPLSESESGRLIEVIAGGAPLASEARERIIRTAEGNPLFLEQLLVTLQEQGTDVTDAVPARQGRAVPSAPAIHALLTARLDHLPTGDRRLLGLAAIEGEIFQPRILAELSGEQRADVQQRLVTLTGKGFVRPEHDRQPAGDVFCFRHGLIREVAYDMLTKGERADLHARFASFVEHEAGTPDEILGYHLEQAFWLRSQLGPPGAHETELAQRAGQRLGSAGLQAFRRADMPAAVNLLERAARILPDDDPVRTRCLPDLSFALFQTGELARADAIVNDALERATATGESRTAWHARVFRSSVQMFRDPAGIHLPAITAMLEEATRAFADLGDDLGVARAWSYLYDARLWSGLDGPPLEQAAQRTVEYARRAGSQFDELWGIGNYGYALLDGPATVVDGLNRLEGLASGPDGGSPGDDFALSFIAVHQAMLGDNHRADELIARGRDALLALGVKWALAVTGLMGTRVATLVGDAARAEREARFAEEIFRAAGDHWFTAIAVIDVADALCQQRRHDDARRFLQRLEDVPLGADPEILFKLPTVEARLLAHEGRLDEAEARAEAATVLLPNGDFLNFRAEAFLALAEARCLAGRPDDAADAIARALTFYQRKGNIVRAEAARALPLAAGRRNRTTRG
jgi:class 3 adenylate cyclase/tetratricopeptide (TPR) repeat protein